MCNIIFIKVAESGSLSLLIVFSVFLVSETPLERERLFYYLLDVFLFLPNTPVDLTPELPVDLFAFDLGLYTFPLMVNRSSLIIFVEGTRSDLNWSL